MNHESAINVTLDNEDLNVLKSSPIVSSNGSTLYITYTANTIEDIYNNKGPALDMLPADFVLLDVTGPAVENFDLDIDSSTLVLSFSETVNMSTFDLSQITIHNNEVPASSVQLSTPASPPIVMNLANVIIVLSREDINKLKALQDLAFDENSTYINVTTSLVMDIRGNNNRLIPSPLRVNNYTADSEPLEFLRFDLNLTSNTLSLYFEEPTDIGTFQHQ